MSAALVSRIVACRPRCVLACRAATCYLGRMKRLALGAIPMGTLVQSLAAQDFIAPDQPLREVVPEEIIESKPTIEGIVKEIFETRKPWQMVNPAAPASYGSGQKMVSKDFGPGTPYKSSGWILFGIEW